MSPTPNAPIGSTKKLFVRGASRTPGDGLYIALNLTLAGTAIESGILKFNGCPAAQMAACGVLTFVKGRTVQQVLLLDAGDLGLLVGGFAPARGFYAAMGIEALRRCLTDGSVT